MLTRLIDKMLADDYPSRNLLYFAIILLAALAVYSGGFGNQFLINWDDPLYIVDNPDIHSITLDNLWKIFTTYYIGTYAPVQMLSHMLEYALWGAQPLPFILVNVCLHSLNGYLFYRILCRLRFSQAWALVAALLFTIHPVQVESVVWISQLKNVLAMTFFLSAFWQYLSYTKTVENRWRRYALAMLFFLLALLTKSVVVVFPAVLLAYDLTLREQRENFLTLAVEKLPFALIASGVAWLTVVSQSVEHGGGRAHELLGGSVTATVLTMMTVYKDYLFNLFWPLQLSAEYHVGIKQTVDFEVFYSAALLVAPLAIAVLAGRNMRKASAFWWAVFFIGFIPVSQIVPFIHLMNDRYLYFPMLGFSAGMVLFLRGGIERSTALTRPVLLGTFLILLLLGSVAWQRTGVWASSFSLWQDAAHKQPGSATAWEGLGHAREEAGDYQEAIADYRRALALNPSAYETHYKLGSAFILTGDAEPAIKHLRKALDLYPDYDKALYNLGYIYMLSGQYDAAVAAFERGIRLDPQGFDIFIYLGASYYAQGNLSAARQVYAHVRQNNENSAFSDMATVMLALVTLREGDRSVSNRLYQESLARGFSAEDIYLNWARLEAIGQRREESLNFISKARALRAADLSALYDDPAFWSLRNDDDFIRMVKP